MQTFDPILYIFEAEFASERDYSDPIRDVTVVATFAGPQGEERSVEAFWDGNRTWRVRFSPPFPGEWGYETACSETGDAGLHRQNGRFTAGAYTGDHPLLRHGSIRRSEDNLSLAHADGTPFFWMADTAWNGVLKAEPAGWDLYLATRKDQGFSAIQAVISPWRSCPTNAAGEPAFTGTESIEINPAFYPGIDANIKAIAAHGLVPSPVMIWACTPGDPGYFLPAEDLTRLARYEVARYAAYRPIWILGGDGEYRGQSAEKWRVTGRAVFGDAGDQPVTMHPQGTNWPGEELRDEPWLTFHSYQSGHGDNDRDLRWLQTGPPATQWMTEPLKPVINQEPNYEGHISYHKKQVFDAYHVRRALYWSLLVTPTAGVTYGHHGIWPWMEEAGLPPDHPHSGEAPTWREALQAEGAQYIRHVRHFFDQIAWWKLRPAQRLLAAQPGDDDPNHFIAAASIEDEGLVVAYTPIDATISLAISLARARWFDPRTGAWRETAAGVEFTTPDVGDWLLIGNRE